MSRFVYSAVLLLCCSGTALAVVLGPREGHVYQVTFNPTYYDAPPAARLWFAINNHDGYFQASAQFCCVSAPGVVTVDATNAAAFGLDWSLFDPAFGHHNFYWSFVSGWIPSTATSINLYGDGAWLHVSRSATTYDLWLANWQTDRVEWDVTRYDEHVAVTTRIIGSGQRFIRVAEPSGPALLLIAMLSHVAIPLRRRH